MNSLFYSLSKETAYCQLKEQLIGSTGLVFYADRDEQLTELIGRRLSDLGLRDCLSYAAYLADGEQGAVEMDILIAQLTIGETCFFRDEAQFAAIRDVILPDILERNKYSCRLRIWSAGCATGAEPYSLAILLTRHFAAQMDGWQVEICATDLNVGYLAQAAEGKFRPWAVRGLTDELKRECFSQAGLISTVHPRYRDWISFHRVNLAAGELSPPFSTAAYFDLILCCNVMIYFSAAVNHRLAKRFHHALGEGGWLAVGASEHNRQNYTAFRTVDACGSRAYQKVRLPQTPPPQEPPGGQVGPAPVESRPLLPAEPKPAAAPAVSPKPVRGGVERLLQLADCGDWQGAAEYGSALAAQDKLNPSIHFYRALIFEKLGRADELERSLRQAIYLDRNFALAHYQLGLALKRDRQTIRAARSFENVLRILADMADDAAITAGPEVTVAGLKELAKMHLENSDVV